MVSYRQDKLGGGILSRNKTFPKKKKIRPVEVSSVWLAANRRKRWPFFCFGFRGLGLESSNLHHERPLRGKLFRTTPNEWNRSDNKLTFLTESKTPHRSPYAVTPLQTEAETEKAERAVFVGVVETLHYQFTPVH